MPIETKTISELKGHRFVVPSYQRGYRWTEHEVTALLDDVMEFAADLNKKYCIQPLIVKVRDDGLYEVVDGQQRLTTIYIFMKVAQQEIRSAVPPFEIEYDTKKEITAFLQDLHDVVPVNSKNIDCYHISLAYNAVEEWLEKQDDFSVAVQQLNTKLRQSVFFIWYELQQDSEPIPMFTKVNLGKIPLTNAELIKALILNKDNFSADIYKRQTEISLAWDRIEQGLRDDSFWYFLNDTEHNGTRIDMLFELLAKDMNNTLPTQISTDQNYFPFLVFSEIISDVPDKEVFVKQLWSKVEKLYAEFRDWYSDLDKYHIIGFLIASGTNISDISSISSGKRKSEVMTELLHMAEKIAGGTDRDTLSALAYGKDNKKIRRILLLFNIATLVCKSEKQYRFPFDIYKGEAVNGQKWDIEHIHATADETDDADDAIWNLTLLDCRTNRSQDYACEPFQIKRFEIIKRESKGLFVPLCTKNVFLKVYTKNIMNMDLWTDNDKKDYLDAICSTLTQFFAGGQIHV